MMTELMGDLIKSLHAAIARRSWDDVESAANAITRVGDFRRKQVKELEAIIASMRAEKDKLP